jgi:hypothetical protein
MTPHLHLDRPFACSGSFPLHQTRSIGRGLNPTCCDADLHPERCR